MPDTTRQVYFISTSIPYVNARPHVGHALEFVQTSDSPPALATMSGTTVMRRSARIASASRSVGPFAPSTIRRQRSRSALCAPSARTFLPRDVDLVRSYAMQAAVALANARHFATQRALATRDPDTITPLFTSNASVFGSEDNEVAIGSAALSEAGKAFSISSSSLFIAVSR